MPPERCLRSAWALGTFYGCVQLVGGVGTAYSAGATRVAMMMVVDAVRTPGNLTII